MELQSEGWGECREKEGRCDRKREGAVPGAIVLSVSCWRGRTKTTGGLWHITCLSHSLWLFALLFSHTLTTFTVEAVWLLCICPVSQPPFCRSHSSSFTQSHPPNYPCLLIPDLNLLLTGRWGLSRWRADLYLLQNSLRNGRGRWRLRLSLR